MSGGSYDYSFHKVEDMADQLMYSKEFYRVAFAKHLKLVAEAMHDVEWVDSSDCSPGDEIPAITKVLGSNAETLFLKEAIIKAEETLEKLKESIEAARKIK